MKIAKEMANKIIWIGLTPVIDEIHNSREVGFLRFSEDVHNYDNHAKQIMRAHSIPFIDIHNFTKNLGEDIYSDHVHFKEGVRKLQAAFIAGHVNSI